MKARETDFYFTVERIHGPEILKEKGSRFLGFVYPIASRENITQILTIAQKEYHSASHLCYASRWTDTSCGGPCGKSLELTGDAGEPAGTAGVPILNEIKRRDCLNLLLLVVRYFGGTKLGKGGLARAYGNTARMVLKAASLVKEFYGSRFRVTLRFELLGVFMGLADRHGIKILKKDFTTSGVRIEFFLPESNRQAFSRLISESTRGESELIRMD